MPSPRALVVAIAMMSVPAAAEEATPSPSPAPSYAEEVVVTASRSEQPLASAPVSMAVVSRRQIEVTPARNVVDLLRALPGMNATQVTAQQQELASRSAARTGTNSQLVLLDGRSVYIDFLGFIEWDALPVEVEELERVEVLSGPGSAVWGANALTGVINMITRAPEDSRGGLLTLGAGQQGTLLGRLRWAGGGQRTAFKGSAGWFEQDPWPREPYLSGGVPLPEYVNRGTRQPKADLRADHTTASDAVWSFRAGYGGMSGLNLNSAGPWWVQPGSAAIYGGTRYSKGARDADLYLDHVRMDAPNQFSDLDNRLRATSLSGNLVDRRVVHQSHVLTYGGSGRASTCDLAVAPRAGGRTEAGLFVQDETNIGERLTLTLGARADWFSTIGAVLSPRASLVGRLGKQHSLRLSFGRGYRPPAAWEFYADIVEHNVLPLPTGPFSVATRLLGSEDVREERLDALELGYHGRLGSRITVQAAAYRTSTKGLVQVLPTAFYSPATPPAGWPLPAAYVPALPSTLTALNSGDVVNRGLEASLRANLAEGLSASASWTWQDDPAVSSAPAQSPVLFARPPRTQASLRVDLARGRWLGSAGVAHVAEAYWSDVLDSRFWGPTEAYTLLDASAGVRFAQRHALMVRGTNLADRPIKQHYFGDVIGRRLLVEARLGF